MRNTLLGAVVTALLLGAAVLVVTHRDHTARAADAGGLLQARDGRQLAAGAPWGVPCQPVLLAVDPGVPASISAALTHAATQARAAGVPVAVFVAKAKKVLPASVMTLNGRTVAPVEVTVDAVTAVDWDAVPIAGSASDRLTRVRATIAPDGDLGAAALSVIARSQGVAGSPGFAAIRRAAGC